MKAFDKLAQRWASLAARERQALVLAAVLLLALALWSGLLGPALRTLREAPAQTQALDAELEHMQRLQLRAQALQSQPALAPSVAEQLLRSYAAALGKDATLQLHGDQATLTLVRVPAQNLSQWLADARADQLASGEVHLQSEGSAADVRWSGSLVFQLPAVGR